MKKRTKVLYSVVSILLVLMIFVNFGCKTQTAQPTTKYPEKAVQIICPWAAGGGTDALARFMGDQLQKNLVNRLS